jgi:hypothetical protein
MKGGEPTESARGLAQSKTLPRDPKVHGLNARQTWRRGFPLAILSSSSSFLSSSSMGWLGFEDEDDDEHEDDWSTHPLDTGSGFA